MAKLTFYINDRILLFKIFYAYVIIVVKDDSLGTNKKKQRISSSNNAINAENGSNKKGKQSYVGGS